MWQYLAVNKLMPLTHTGGAGSHRAGTVSDASCNAQQVAADGLSQHHHCRDLLQPGAVDTATATTAGRHWQHPTVRTHPTVAC